MRRKTSADLISALKGSAFRKATFDGRTWDLRRVKTLGHLRRSGPQGAPRSLSPSLRIAYP
ncbi:MAG TPA: hypothetical protein VF590_02570 [Isosphaeraceae bacterium]|jgi:hypothetical protein